MLTITLSAVASAGDPGTHPHDMSVAQHQSVAAPDQYDLDDGLTTQESVVTAPEPAGATDLPFDFLSFLERRLRVDRDVAMALTAEVLIHYERKLEMGS